MYRAIQRELNTFKNSDENWYPLVVEMRTTFRGRNLEGRMGKELRVPLKFGAY
jgi:hypothetical protein